MTLSCAVAHCKNQKTKDTANTLSFHKFPKTATIRNAWIARCGRPDKFNPDTAAICSEHFTKDDYEGPLRAELMTVPYKKILKRTAIPSVACALKPEFSIATSPEPEKILDDDDVRDILRITSPEILREELRKSDEKLRHLILEYEVLKRKSQEQECTIKELQKENTLLKKKLFSKDI